MLGWRARRKLLGVGCQKWRIGIGWFDGSIYNVQERRHAVVSLPASKIFTI